MNTYTEKITVTEKVKRTQAIIAMESLIKTMGGRAAYIAWLSAMPEGTELTTAGGLSSNAAAAIADNTEHYTRMVKTFADNMVPVLQAEAKL